MTHKNVNCLLVGNRFYEFKDRYLGFSFYKEFESVINFLKNNPVIHSTLLIKGSRGIKLEKLVEYL